MNNQTTFVKACLERLVPELVGSTITGGIVDPGGEYWGFAIEGRQDGKSIAKSVFVLADPEGNGPGFLDIQGAPDTDRTEGKSEAPEAQGGEAAQAAMAGKPLFDPGRVVATPGALAALEENGQGCLELLERHVRGDWGELCVEDRQANEEALEQGLRLLSAYRLRDGTKLWVVTEADRSSTCCLLPSEY